MGGRLLHNGATILTWNVLFAVAVNEAIRKSSTSGTNVYIEINATFPVHTLDIVNQKSTVNATLTVTVVTSHTGAVTLSPTGSNMVLTVGGTNYSEATVPDQKSCINRVLWSERKKEIFTRVS